MLQQRRLKGMATKSVECLFCSVLFVTRGRDQCRSSFQTNVNKHLCRYRMDQNMDRIWVEDNIKKSLNILGSFCLGKNLVKSPVRLSNCVCFRLLCSLRFAGCICQTQSASSQEVDSHSCRSSCIWFQCLLH